MRSRRSADEEEKRMGEKQSKRKMWIVIGVGALLLVIAAAAGILAVSHMMSRQSYSESIKTAEKYVQEGNYEQAVVSYQNAIEEMPEEEDGYMGLADVYLQQDETSSAKVILKKGYLITDSPKIRYMLDGIEDGTYQVRLIGDPQPEKETMEYKGEFGWNVSFLQQLQNFSYQDFQTEYGSSPDIVEVAKGELEVVHPDLAATCYYSNTAEHDDIVDVNKDRPDASGMPEKVTLDSLSLLFNNFSGSVTLDKLQKLSSTKVEPVKTKERTYVELTTGSLDIYIETDEAGNIVSDDAWNEIILTDANKYREEKGLVTGVVIDAVSGEGVPGAKIEFAAKQDASHSDSVSTGSDGAFSLELDADQYDVSITADGYVEEEFEFEVEENKNYSGEQFVISPALAEGTARIVLEWGAEPRDLDSYLTGETDSGTDVSVSFSDKTCSSGSETIAELDVDDTTGYGPETITLYDLNGVYRYTVKDFRRTRTLQQYGATVKVYLPGQAQPEVITVAPNAGIVNIWEVFELDHGELRILNRAGNENSTR